MRLIFVATGDIALPSFRHLLDHGPRPLALVTQPDKPVGRHQALRPPAIKREAIAAGIPVFQPQKISEIDAELAALEPDVMVVMAYGQILGKATRAVAGLATINLHASLLPRYRGASCIQAAIDAGDAETGITAMHVVRELDAGDIILAKSIGIAPDETGGVLHDRLAVLAPEVLAEVLQQLSTNSNSRTPQDPAASSYAPKLDRDDGKLDWNCNAVELERRIRAYDPWPGTFTLALEDGMSRRLKIFPQVEVTQEEFAAGSIAFDGSRLVVGCGTGALRLDEVQPEGSRRMKAADYYRGRRPNSFI